MADDDETPDDGKLLPFAARFKFVTPEPKRDRFERMPRGSFADPTFAHAFRFFVLTLIDSYDTERLNLAMHHARTGTVDLDDPADEQRDAIARAMRYLNAKLREVSATQIVQRMGGIYAALQRHVAANDATHFESLDDEPDLAGSYPRPSTDAEKAAIYREALHAYQTLVSTIWMLTSDGELVSFYLADEVPPESWLRRSEDVAV